MDFFCTWFIHMQSYGFFPLSYVQVQNVWLYYMKFLCGLLAISRHPLLSSTICHRHSTLSLSSVVLCCCRPLPPPTTLPPLSIVVVRRGRLPQPLPSLSAAVVVHSRRPPLLFVAADVVCHLPLSSISTVHCCRCRPSSATEIFMRTFK